MQSRKYAFFATAGFALVAAAVGAAWYLWSRPSEAYTNTDFTSVANGSSYAYDSTTNVLIGAFRLPNPVSDSLLHNGATATIADKNPLSLLSSLLVFYDNDNDSAYDDGDAIVNSTDLFLDSADTVITTGVGVLSTFTTTESDALAVYLDQNGNDSSYQDEEDIVRQVVIGSAATVSDGNTIRLFENAVTFFDFGGNSSLDTTDSVPNEAIVNDVDTDGFPSSGDVVITAGGARVEALTTADNICFDASVVADAEYDVNEVIWYDSSGDCTFNSGTDVILVGSASPSGTSTEFGTEQEIAFLDSNNGGSYTCTRTGTCEPIVYSGATGANLTDDANITTSTVFFDSSAEATNGVKTTGVGWDESGASEQLMLMNAALVWGVQRYAYVDANASATYTDGEDIFSLIEEGSTASMATGQTLRMFDANEKYLKIPGESFFINQHAIVRSSDANLNAGLLNGSGVDAVIHPSSTTSMLDAFPSTTKFHDHDASGAYADGDDIITDVDESGYYNADDLLTLAVDALPEAGDEITDSYLSGVYVYQRVGSTCAGSGTDTLLGSDTSSPFLNQSMTITKAAYAAADTDSSRTLCVYADIANNSSRDHAKVWTLLIGSGDADFSSTGTSPSSNFTAVTASVQFVAPLTASITASTPRPSTTSSYIVSYLNNDDVIENNRGLMGVTFPSGYNVANATASCTVNGVASGGTTTISGQKVLQSNGTGSSVTLNSTIACTIQNIVNPSSAGVTSTFVIRTFNTSTDRTYQLDTDNTVTLTSGGSSSSESTPVSYSIALTAPNGGETLAAGSSHEIVWSSSMNMGAVDIAYSTDGTAYTSIVDNAPDTGSYLWQVPSVDAASVLVRVAGTDLLTELATDTSDAAFAISTSATASTDASGTVIEEVVTGGEVVEEEPSVEEASIAFAEVTSGMYIKSSTEPTVYLVDEDMNRRPFLNPETYFTYADSFDQVSLVDVETLTLLPLEDVMLPAPGVSLVKWTFSPDVYVVDQDASLARISSEDYALAVFGSEWADYVVTMDDAFWTRFSVSGDLASTAELDASTFKKRYLLDGIADTDGDGIGDVAEDDLWGSNPMSTDSDGDGYDDLVEITHGYSPVIPAEV